MHLQRTERTYLIWILAKPPNGSKLLDQIVDEAGPDRVNFILDKLMERARENGVDVPVRTTTDYINTIPVDQEVAYPGDWPTERRLKSLMRWNAMTMVSHQNKEDDGIGGHIATYASLATLLEVGFHHFFRGSYSGQTGELPGDFVYFQGHASPGVYARAFLEGRLTEQQLKNFRHELRGEPGLSSYPHPWLMKDFWQFPTVSMGLGPINAIYQAKFMRYLENRGMIESNRPARSGHFWATARIRMSPNRPVGAIHGRYQERKSFDNLIFVINCNLQALSTSPVRGNGKVVNELEGLFRGAAGWNVIKCLWGCDWDRFVQAKDTSGRLVQLMNECLDGEYHGIQGERRRSPLHPSGILLRRYPETARLVEDMTDEQIGDLHPGGGHDPRKVYNAYKAAVMKHKGGPTRRPRQDP